MLQGKGADFAEVQCLRGYEASCSEVLKCLDVKLKCFGRVKVLAVVKG